MSSKRSHAEMQGDTAPGVASPFMPLFEHFRGELDQHHDRRERIIKASRDITAASKKIGKQYLGTISNFFRLIKHSIRAVKQPLPQNVVKSNKQYYDIISTQFASVSRDLQGLNAHRYARQISGGCQEWMEAASFQHYLTTAKLLTYEDSVALMRSLDPDGPGVELSPEDYMLGIYDMTGELMRFSITAMATNGALPLIKDDSEDVMTDVTSVGSERSVLNDMRALRSALEAFNAGHGPFAKDSDKKMEVMRQSVEKVERSLYGLVVRGAERPKGWLPDADGPRPVEVES